MIKSFFLKVFIANLILEIQLNLSKKTFEEVGGALANETDFIKA